MIAADQFHFPTNDEDEGVRITWPQARFIAGIRDDLRGLYGDVASNSQPDYLMELASRIDDLRRTEGHED